MSLKPLRDYVLVTKDEAPQQTAGGLFLPGTVEDKVVQGTVVSVGSGHLTSEGAVVPLEVVVGNKILFNRNHATDLKADGTTLFLLREDQIMCVL